MITVYLICFVLGLVMSLLAAFTGLGRVHFGHVHFGRIHLGHVHPGHAPAAHGHAFVHGGQTPSSANARAGSTQSGTEISALNGFTLPAFLCWFGGVGYLLASRTPMARVLCCWRRCWRGWWVRWRSTR